MRYLPLLSVFFLAKSFAQDPREILTKASEALESKKSVSYYARGGQKFFDHEDTSKVEGTIYLWRNEKDTVFNMNFTMDLGESVANIYDGRYICQVLKNENKVTRYDVALNQVWIVTSNLSERLLWDDFGKPGNLSTRTATENKLTLLGDTIINKQPCFRLTIRYPDEEEFTDQMRTMCIRKKDYITVFTAFQIKYQGNYQYDFLKLTEIEFDKVKPEVFTLKSFSKLPVEDYKQPTEEEIAKMYALLDTNTLAPALKGHIYNSDEAITEINYTGKVTMLDFWYMACGWCIKSFPYIEKLREKFGDKLTVYGINSYDNNEKSMAKMPKFFEHNHVGYATVMVDNSFVDACKVRVWPTFYLIGPDGKIIYSQMGAIADDATLALWEKIIEEAIKK